MKHIGFSRVVAAVLCAAITTGTYAGKSARVPVGTGTFAETQAWSSNPATNSCIGDGTPGSATATFANDGTFAVVLPSDCVYDAVRMQSYCQAYGFSGTATEAARNTIALALDSASALVQRYRYVHRAGGFESACVIDSATVTHATLMLDKRQRNATLHVSATAAETDDAGLPVTVGYTLDASGTWQRAGRF